MKKSLLARDLMSSPVRRLTLRAPVQDAAAFLLRHGISGAPVEDEHGRWKGVFSMNDIARAVAIRLDGPRTERSLEGREPVPGGLPPALDELGSLQVADLMTPGMVTVFPETTLEEVVHSLLSFNVHRVFVLQEEGEALLGVITTMDVIRRLDEKGNEGTPVEQLRRLP